MQGRSNRADRNELLGEFLLDGLREAGRGELKIDIKFEISADGMVSVSARDQETGQSQNLTVTASSGLTDEEIQDMVDRTKQISGHGRNRRGQEPASRGGRAFSAGEEPIGRA